MDISRYSDDINRVNEEIINNLSSSPPEIKKIINDSYLLNGKKIRPLITILSYRSTNGEKKPNDKIYSMAAGIELIHIATLIHDDINDNSEFRRGSPTINSIYGNNVAQIIGDVLFAKAFGLCSLFDNEIVQTITQACINLGEGELIQHQNIDNTAISKETIIKIIQLKTASLFSAAAYCGACLAGVSSEKKKLLYNFGSNLGIAFQISDDINDYTSHVNIVGKDTNRDLDEGKITLPMYFILNDVSITDKYHYYLKLKSDLLNKKEKFQELYLDNNDALEKSYKILNKFCDYAKKDLEIFNRNDLTLLVENFQGISNGKIK